MNTASKTNSKSRNWLSDEIGRGAFPLVHAFLACLGLALLSSCGRENERSVVVYAAQDQAYAEPILKKFTAETGIRTRVVYDSEAVKTVGLANRLLAERGRPQCDVFWGNEELRTRQLAAQGVFRETNGWAGFGFRSRRLVANTNKISRLDATSPLSLLDLTNGAWRGKVAMAYPMFGTTSAHLHALRQFWGDTKWQRWCRAMQDNKTLLLDGNSQVVKMVGRGEAWIGVTDSDDIAAGQNDGMPIVALPITGETLLIPNTVAVVRGGQHPREAERLFQYLQRREVVEHLMAAQALEGVTPGARPHLKVDWDSVLKHLESTTAALKEIFLR